MATTEVQVQLFGTLARLAEEPRLALEMQGPATLAQVLTALGTRIGAPFCDLVMRAPGVPFNHCRIFADGRSVQAPETPLISAGQERADLELIILTPLEGG